MPDKPKLQVTLLTGRTIEQGVMKEHGKVSEDYAQSVAVCFLDQADMKLIGVDEGNTVRLSTEYGSIVLRALRSLRGPHAGIVFVPYGPWANVIVDPSTGSIGMPSFKGMFAWIEPCPNESITALGELLKREFGEK